MIAARPHGLRARPDCQPHGPLRYTLTMNDQGPDPAPRHGRRRPPRPHPSTSRSKPFGLAEPFRWLRLGWNDFRRVPVIGQFYRACFAAMGSTLLLLFQHPPAYTLALSAGFLLMGPFMCLGLYDASRKVEGGERPGLWASLTASRARTGTMAIFGAVLLLLEMLWGRASLIVFALSFDGMPDFKGALLALLDPENLPFIVAGIAVGGLFAGLILAIRVVATPMILDRQTNAITAGLASLRPRPDPDQGSSTEQPVFLRASRSRCACATSASA